MLERAARDECARTTWHARTVTTVLGVLGALVVLLAAAVVAVRDEPLLAEAPPDRPEPRLPDDRALQADDLEDVRFDVAVRGYRMAQVDAVLERAAGELRDRDARLERAEAEVARLRALMGGSGGAGLAGLGTLDGQVGESGGAPAAAGAGAAAPVGEQP